MSTENTVITIGEEQQKALNSVLFGQLVLVVKTFKLIVPEQNPINKEYIRLLKEVNTDESGYVLNIMGKHYLFSNQSNDVLDKMISFYCFYVSAELDNMDSMAIIGDFYKFGIYFKIDKEKAFSYYMKSIQTIITPKHIHHRQSVIGFSQLGDLYKKNTILPIEMRNKMVFETFSKGLYHCNCEVPCSTERVFCIKPEYETKYCYYMNLKNTKYCVGIIFELGMCYLNGIGVVRNTSKYLEYIIICSKLKHFPSLVSHATYYFINKDLNPENPEKAFRLYFDTLLYINSNLNNEGLFKNKLSIIKNMIKICDTNQVHISKKNNYYLIFIYIYMKYLKFETDVTLKDTYFTKFKEDFTKNVELQRKNISILFLLDVIIPECKINDEPSCFVINSLLEKRFWSYKNRLFYPPSFNAKFNLVFLSSKRYYRQNQIFIPIEIYLIIFEFLPFEKWGSFPEQQPLQQQFMIML